MNETLSINKWGVRGELHLMNQTITVYYDPEGWDDEDVMAAQLEAAANNELDQFPMEVDDVLESLELPFRIDYDQTHAYDFVTDSVTYNLKKTQE